MGCEWEHRDTEDGAQTRKTHEHGYEPTLGALRETLVALTPKRAKSSLMKMTLKPDPRLYTLGLHRMPSILLSLRRWS